MDPPSCPVVYDGPVEDRVKPPNVYQLTEYSPETVMAQVQHLQQTLPSIIGEEVKKQCGR